MAVLRCKMCGGELVKRTDGLFLCQSCGSIQTLEDNKESATQRRGSHDEIPIEIYESTYASAEKLLAKANFDEAAKLYARIEDYRDSAAKFSLCRSAIEKKEREDIYECAYRIMTSATTEREYLNACSLFGKIEGYKDSSVLKTSCSSAAEQCRSAVVYEKACSFAANQSIHFLLQAVELFNTIPSYKDSKQKRDCCLDLINRQQNQLSEKNAALVKARNQKKKRRKIIIVAVIAAIVCGIALKIGITKITHSVNDIEISITDVTPKSDSKYYYLYTDFTIINNTGATIDYLEVTAYFKDSKGKSVGTMTSTFGSSYGNSSLNLKAHQKTIESTYLSEWYNSSSMSDLFVTLYNDGMNGLTVSYEIICVEWSDGNSYSR